MKKKILDTVKIVAVAVLLAVVTIQTYRTIVSDFGEDKQFSGDNLIWAEVEELVGADGLELDFIVAKLL